MARSQWGLPATALLVCLAYALGSALGFALTPANSPLAVLWPANTILLGGLLLTPYRGWWLVLLLVGAAHLALQVSAGISVPMACCWLFSNALQAVLGAWLVRGLAPDLRLSSVRRLMLILAAAALVAPLLVSVVDVALVKLMSRGQHSWWELWQRRFWSNLVATLLFLPPLLFWNRGLPQRLRQASPARWLEALLLWLLMAALAAYAFKVESAHMSPRFAWIWMLPCLWWMALRCAPFLVSLALLAFGLLAAFQLMRVGGGDDAHAVLATQWLVIAGAVPVLTILALRQEVQRLRWRSLLAQAQGARRLHHPGAAFCLPGQAGRAASRPVETENFASQRENLEQMSRVAVLGKLAAALAHELNQPLAAILSNAQAARRFLIQQPVDLDEIRKILDDIVNEDRRAGEVIHRLRSLFVKGELKLHILSLNELVQEVIELSRADLIERQIDFVLHLSTERPEARGDRVQLQQVLLNFVMNASEAIRSGDAVRGRLEISTERQGEQVCVSVSDNGPGVPPALLERVFEAFFTTKKNGMGFGLSISSIIVHQHGGRIDVSNNREGGACFSMVLPRHQEIRRDL